jgi:hypothetical protein
MMREFEDQKAGDTRMEAYLRTLHGEPAPARRAGRSRWFVVLAIAGPVALDILYLWLALSK